MSKKFVNRFSYINFFLCHIVYALIYAQFIHYGIIGYTVVSDMVVFIFHHFNSSEKISLD